MSSDPHPPSIPASRSWQLILFEIVAIAFSVLFALFLSEWWQGLKEQEDHRRVLQLVLSELETNSSEIEESIEYYTRISEQLLPILGEEPISMEKLGAIEGCCQISWNGGTKTAHETAILDGLYTALDPQVSATLVAPYVGREALDAMRNAGLMSMVNTDASDTVEKISRYFIFASLIAPAEQEILELLNEAIEAAEKELEK